MQYKFFFAALILLISHCSFAQSFRYTQYTTHNGLPVDNIYAAAQDDNGYMWFATDFGIAKFDGYRFITFNRNNGIQAKAITDIVYAGGDSCVFLAYPGYIQSINGKGQVHTIAYVPNISLHQLVRFKNILLFYERGKNIFGILKHGAIENIDLEKFTGMQGLTVNAVTAFNENTVAVSTNKGLFVKKENETAVQYYKNENTAYAILKRNGNIAAVSKDFYTELDIVTGLVKTKKLLPGKESVLSMMEDAEGNVWLRGMTKGIYLNTGNSITDVSAALSLQNKVVNKFFTDADRNVWLCTDGAGVILKKYKTAVNYFTQNGLANNKVLKLFNAGSNILIGTSNGISIKNNAGISRLQLPQRKKTLQYVHHFFACKGSDFGVNVTGTFDNDTGILQQPFLIKQLQQYKIAYTERQAVYQQSGDTVWTADKFVLKLLVNGVAVQSFSLKHFGLRKVYCLKPFANTIFIGTADGLVTLVNNKFTKIDTILQKGIGEVFEMLVINNQLYFATDQGLLIYNNSHYSFGPAALTYGGNYCRSITADNEGNIWAATWDGIYVTDGKSRINYSTANGLSSKICNAILYNSADNKIYTGTDNGLCVIDKTKLTVHAFNNKVSIACYVQDTLPVNNGVQLKSNQRSMRFYVNLPFYGAAEEIIYQYKIDNGKWQSTSSPYINLPDISSGKHAVHARAIFNGTPVVNTESMFKFIVQEKFYKTWWFWVPLLIATQYAVFKIINRYNKNKRKKQQQAQQQQAEVASLKQQAFTSLMNPHFIFNALNSIQHYINKQDRLAANKYLSDFATLVRRSFESAQKAFVPLEEELETVRLYLQLEKMRFTDKFNYSITLNKEAEEEEWMLPGMVLQPFLENAILHGLAPLNSHGQINIDIKGANNTLYISITDNGIGMQKSKQLHTAKKHNSRGMQLIKERLDILSKKSSRPVQLTITELNPGAENPGTTIQLVVPQEVYENGFDKK